PSASYAAILEGGQYLGTSESPIVGHMPAELAARLGDGARNCGAFAHFRIVVREGTPAERRQMIETCVNRADMSGNDAWRDSPSSAVREAIWSARQDDFLPTIAQWVREAKHGEALYLDGLALRRD